MSEQLDRQPAKLERCVTVNPLAAIKGIVDQYAVAFLDAGVSQEAAIFWGSRDEDRAIVDVQLRRESALN